jgi:hypothetical protein
MPRFTRVRVIVVELPEGVAVHELLDLPHRAAERKV